MSSISKNEASSEIPVASYVLKQKLRGRKRYPLVLMLEPLISDRVRRGGPARV